ncbi:4-alpha-glucanotransferase [uncultured Roseburia sp.]|uniref:4-alpha-glucanotransferase n=1 Tax=Brotonthovivens ammoniilytica TaxID=2981725 RepID=A0ABT2TFK3_9FIRM|nr:4-alpha-glucanotransferase [Brotonthovivens ammoniilytica]MCU6760959.1 4-alpha-glucanotransferase [Brotonthovivens ammoniilytica]SCI14643.1 4-alpha-glucanotransferase [uncultured Roseburia sp.]
MRSSGILMHISSLPSPYGIGTLGEEAKKFVDFLSASGQTYWQVLPICPTGFGDSPYQSFSTFAGNPYFIDLDYLCHDGLLTKEECCSYDWGSDKTAVDYGLVYWNRMKILKQAYERFQCRIPYEYQEFCEKNKDWLEDYAVYMAFKEANQGSAWHQWDGALKRRDPQAVKEAKQKFQKEINFWKMTQFLFFCHWHSLKAYANERGIRLIGDIPIYVSSDSADVWADPELFVLDEDLNPTEVAGCPPDAFTEDGQLWGNPLFRWDKMEQDGFAWWTKRVRHLSELFDIVRIDHFRGFESYYAIPAGDKNAKRGVWKKGPGLRLFQALKQKLGDLNIIVEDLGFLTPEVLKMVQDCGFPGMKLLQFAFDARDNSAYLPHNHIKNCVVYSGSHDNDTILGWMKNSPRETVEYAAEYLGLTVKDANWGMMKAVWASVADTAIVTMQDLLGLGDEARMNIPSTTGNNWKWRMKPDALSQELAGKIYHQMINYARLRK